MRYAISGREQIAFQGLRRLQEILPGHDPFRFQQTRDVEHVRTFRHCKAEVEHVAAPQAIEYISDARWMLEFVFSGLKSNVRMHRAHQQELPGISHHSGVCELLCYGPRSRAFWE